MSGNRFRLAALLLFTAVVFLLWTSGTTEALLDPERLRNWVSRAGLFGPLVFAGAFLCAIYLFMPPTAFALLAGFLFGPVAGLLLAVACVNGGGLLLFLTARKLGREGTREWLERRLSALDHGLEEHGLLAVVALRLIFVPFSVVCLWAGVSSVRKRDYLLGTLVGTFPATFLLAWLGDAVLNVWKNRDPSALATPGGLAALLLFLFAMAFPFVWKRRRKSSE